MIEPKEVVLTIAERHAWFEAALQAHNALLTNYQGSLDASVRGRECAQVASAAWDHGYAFLCEAKKRGMF